MRVMITGGGTGGHTSPAVAIIEELHKRDPKLLVQWVGKKGAIEERVSEQAGVPFRPVNVEGWPRKRSLRQAVALAKLAIGICRAYFYLKRFQPHAVVGVGGYVSLPLCYAAQKMGIPTVLHEQNKRLGMANQLLAARATRLLLSYPETIGNFPADKARVVGNPVRAGFIKPPESRQARTKLNLDPAIPVVLVSGGSQGAHTLNAAMAEVIGLFKHGEVQFLWMTGQADVGTGRAAAGRAPVRVEVFPFIDDMVTACAASDLMVGRSGASSAAEIAVLGKPSILVPYPHATDNHQEQNARAFEVAGASIILLDADCSGENLAHLIRQCITDTVKLQQMARAAASLAKPGAAEAIVEEILTLAFEEGA